MEIIATNDTSLEMSSRSFDNYYNGIDKSDIDAMFKDSDPFLEEFIEFKRAFYRHKEPGSILLVTLYIPVFLMAFFGNVIVLFVVLPNRHMRNVTNFFLVNLAVADLTVTLVCIPMAVGKSVYKLWIYGNFMCKFTGYLQGVSVASSVFTIMMLSLDRYLAIRHPMTFRAFSAGRHAWKIVLGIWALSLSIMLPLILVRRVQVIDIPIPLVETEPMYMCSEVWPRNRDRTIYDGFLFVFMFIMPGCFVIVSYSRIGCQLWTEGQELYRNDSEVHKAQSVKIMHSRRKVARMLIILAVLFGLCWMPYHLLSFYVNFMENPHGTGALEALPFTIWFGHANSAMNPVLYCFMNKSFRRCASRLVGCGRKRRRKPPESPVDVVVCYSRFNGSLKTSLQYHKRPLIKVWSGASTSRSTSGSIRFSRSSNTSLKSSTRTSDNSYRSDCRRYSPEISPLERTLHSPGGTSPSGGSGSFPLDANFPSLTIFHEREEPSSSRGAYRSRREIFNYTLSIPTTINEESSRSSKTPSPRTERAVFRSLEYDLCDEGENNDIEWVESKILESRLNKSRQQSRSMIKGLNGSSDNYSTAETIPKQVTFKTPNDTGILKDETRPGQSPRTTQGTENVIVHPAPRTQIEKNATVPLIVTEHVEESPKQREEQTGSEVLQKEESRDSGAESDGEMSLSETDMLVSNENDMRTSIVRCHAVPEILDIQRHSARI